MLRPRVYCDFNDRIDAITFGLRARGTRADLEPHQLHLAPGLELTFVDYDAFEDGSSAWIVADGVVADEPGIGFVARIQTNSFRWERRLEHSARITWSHEHTLRGLPRTHQIIDPAWLYEGPSAEAWSLECTFGSPPNVQGSPSSATVRFLVETAPHDFLRVGARLHLFERATQLNATVEILD